MIPDHSFYMKLAIDEAWKYQLLTYPNPAVGGVLISEKGEILSISAHQKSGESHSEVNVFQDAYIKLTNNKSILNCKTSAEVHDFLNKNAVNIFKNSTLYTTLEPCNHFGKTPPCSLLIKNLGVSKVFIGVSDNNKKASGGAEFLEKSGVETIFLESEKSADLIAPFELWNKKRFIFFKYAQTMNGEISNGIISSAESRKFVHAIRDKIDLLVIGGNTVRVDRPTLDSRMVNGKSPDVLIFSNKKDFDKTIPLFTVPNRKVFIENSLEKIEKYNFIMIEGGYKLLQSLISEIDLLLLFISPKLQNSSETFSSSKEQNFRVLHRSNIGEDSLLWLKPN
jgi:diaminohydroxyphosphoribosylaminopyrimidine deaminase/5-amino-6-(5-phosphoribosylamino)uracil reductase